MTVRLPRELEQFVHDAVRAGLYAREDDVIRDALIRLKGTMPEAPATTANTVKGSKPVSQEKKPLSIEEIR
jgi:Arc/MetJ-type ribon-helix-helix transcriptional regulator